MDIKLEIRKMLEAQKVDIQLYRLKRVLSDEMPKSIALVEFELESLKNELKLAEDKHKSIYAKRRELELKDKGLKDSIVKAEAALLQLKSNDEYKFKIAEIEKYKKEIYSLEDEEIASIDECEAADKILWLAKQNFSEKEKVVNEKKAKVATEAEKLKTEILQLQATREIYVKEISPEARAIYEKLIEHAAGTAVVPLVNSACGGCFMGLPMNVFNSIKDYSSFVRCDTCTRILYLESDI